LIAPVLITKHKVTKVFNTCTQNKRKKRCSR